MEHLPETLAKRVEVDRLDRFHAPVRAVVASTPLGRSCINPVACPVAGALETGRIHEGFEQGNGMAVKRLPVPRKHPDVGAQELRGQVLQRNPVQNQEPDVIDDLVEVRFPGTGLPTDEPVAALHLPGR